MNTVTAEPRVLANFIDGVFVPPSGGRYIETDEPATGKVWAKVPDSSQADVDAAVAAAARAFPGWSATPSRERARVLMKLADLIDRDVDRLAEAESRDTGKPIGLARSVDIPRSAENFRFFAGAVEYLGGQDGCWMTDGAGAPSAHSASAASNVQGGGSALNYVSRKPRGVAGLISPWNLPLYLLTWKIAPALATGNVAVCKPSEVTPVTAAMLGELANEAGLPRGVLNVVHGRGDVVGAAIVKHTDVLTISFTGSTAVGRWIGKEAGERLKRVSLELGGKNPFIIFADADIDKAIDTAVRAGFTNQGQVCLCGSRLLIEKSIYPRVRDALVERAKRLVPGDPLEAQTKFGSLTSKPHWEKVAGMVDEARTLGGRILCGGGRPNDQDLPERVRGGNFYLPTVIEGLDPACRIEQEEIFGPVVTLQPFDDEAHAVRLATGTPYGLAATIWTRDVSRAHRVGAQMQSGLVWVNCWMLRDLRTPFGGAKASGVGREGGVEALKFFTEPTNVCISL